MKLLKSLLSLSLVAAAALSMTACTDDQLSFGAGVIVGVIVADDNDHHHDRRPPRYRGRRHHSQTQLAGASPAEIVAMKYNLSAEQAEVLTAHLLPARQGDLSGLAALGFEKNDLRALVAGQNPSASTLLTLSEKLGLEVSEAHQLVQDIKADAITARDNLM